MERAVTSIKDSDRVMYKDWSMVNRLVSNEDIATFIDTFEESKIDGSTVTGVLEKDGKYLFVISDNEDVTGYDFFKELETLAKRGINCANAKLLYPRELSRGYYIENTAVAQDESSTGEIEAIDDGTPTGFLGEDEIPVELRDNSGVSHMLIHISDGSKLPIDEHGIIIGRSSSKSEYVVANGKVSRQHARVYKDGRRYMVHDYNSANGTYIDGLRVFEDLDREIPIGSSLVLGNEEFVFQ